MTRRHVIEAAALAGSAAAAAVATRGVGHAQASQASLLKPASRMPVVLNINGADRDLVVEARETLLGALREQLGLTGTKPGCNHGQCGACTVHADGRRVLSCLTLAVTAQGKRITTIEGIASGDALHRVQQAFIDHDAFQCGYCTSGQIMSAVALAHEPVGPRDADVAEAMSGNLCRCGAYPNIVAAVQATRG